MPLRLDELPLELLVLTLRALSAQELCCCDATCKALHAAARDESLWSQGEMLRPYDVLVLK